MEVAVNLVPRLALLALPLLLLANSAAGAREIKAPQGAREAEIGRGLVCDTQEQAERFVAL